LPKSSIRASLSSSEEKLIWPPPFVPELAINVALPAVGLPKELPQKSDTAAVDNKYTVAGGATKVEGNPTVLDDKCSVSGV
jgi:hypothetical protein